MFGLFTRGYVTKPPAPSLKPSPRSKTNPGSSRTCSRQNILQKPPPQTQVHELPKSRTLAGGMSEEEETGQCIAGHTPHQVFKSAGPPFASREVNLVLLV
ncbi:hypothetical protein PPYR_14533 [Photinus pyralis]|uniref:Uncharacterized protein n=1 Tax=Photinus pyralis TaxID=7054 RepID=A0A1Y1M928_PHOPY|nr:hypothetical protein PPYR_14533 [Photinus pyralis]